MWRHGYSPHPVYLSLRSLLACPHPASRRSAIDLTIWLERSPTAACIDFSFSPAPVHKYAAIPHLRHRLSAPRHRLEAISPRSSLSILDTPWQSVQGATKAESHGRIDAFHLIYALPNLQRAFPLRLYRPRSNWPYGGALSTANIHHHSYPTMQVRLPVGSCVRSSRHSLTAAPIGPAFRAFPRAPLAAPAPFSSPR